jgi:hypothetical protein
MIGNFMALGCRIKKEGGLNEATKKIMSYLKCSKNVISCTAGCKTLWKEKYSVGMRTFLSVPFCL